MAGISYQKAERLMRLDNPHRHPFSYQLGLARQTGFGLPMGQIHFPPLSKAGWMAFLKPQFWKLMEFPIYPEFCALEGYTSVSQNRLFINTMIFDYEIFGLGGKLIINDNLNRVKKISWSPLGFWLDSNGVALLTFDLMDDKRPSLKIAISAQNCVWPEDEDYPHGEYMIGGLALETGIDRQLQQVHMMRGTANIPGYRTAPNQTDPMQNQVQRPTQPQSSNAAQGLGSDLTQNSQTSLPTDTNPQTHGRRYYRPDW